MYSQNNEEQIIKDYFGDHVGTFCSLGENDGITLSNIRALMERGWKGVCVEPSPKAFARLKENIKPFTSVYAYNFALGTYNGEGVFHESGALLNKNDVALVSTFHDSEIARFKNSVMYEPVTVKVFRWKTFLNRLKIKQFDLISIDIEGSDLDVLPQIELIDTRMVIVEWNGKNRDEFIKYCPGFRIIAENGENLIFAR